nr:hypothetical protein [Tanacetum cinerariifolium]
LEEDFVHVRVRLFHFVQQYDAVRFAPHRFGEHAAFAVPDVARRSAFECRDGMGFLELAHVDGDDVLLAAVHRLGQRQRGLGLAHAGSARQHEHADGFAGVIQPGPRGLDA